MKRTFILLICCMLAVLSVYGQNQPFGGAQPFGNGQFGNQQQQSRPFWLRQNRTQPQQQQTPNRSGQFSPTEYWNQQKAFFTEKASTSRGLERKTYQAG